MLAPRGLRALYGAHRFGRRPVLILRARHAALTQSDAERLAVRTRAEAVRAVRRYARTASHLGFLRLLVASIDGSADLWRRSDTALIERAADLVLRGAIAVDKVPTRTSGLSVEREEPAESAPAEPVRPEENGIEVSDELIDDGFDAVQVAAEVVDEDEANAVECEDEVVDEPMDAVEHEAEHDEPADADWGDAVDPIENPDAA